MAMTQAEYARHRGVSREMVGKWIRAGKIPEDAFIDESGKRKIDEAAADLALGQTRERVLAGRGNVGDEDETFGSRANARAVGGSGGASLTAIKTITGGYEARFAALKWLKDIGAVRSSDEIKDAGVKCGEAVVRVLDDKKHRVDELLAVATNEGASGLRRVLNEIVIAEREAIMKAFAELVASVEPQQQPSPEDLRVVGL